MSLILLMEPTIFKYSEDYIYSIKSLLNCEICFYRLPFDNNFIVNNKKYVFWLRLPKNLKISDTTNNIYLFNTEQMCKKYEKWAEQINKTPKQIKIIDFSIENLKYFNNYSTYFLPYQVNYNEIFNLNKTKNICIISDNNISKRRKYILDKLAEKNINVDIISGFGKERDLKLFNYKIILNIGWSECAKIFESIRCDRCIFNKMIVISDPKNDQYNYHLKDFIIFEEYEKIPNRVKYTLDNYANIHENIFENFDIQKIDKRIKNMSISTVNQLLN